jgi:hypothetical protein
MNLKETYTVYAIVHFFLFLLEEMKDIEEWVVLEL